MSQTAPTQTDQRTLTQKLEGMQSLGRFPALTIMVFLRKDIGFRILHPVAIIVMTFLMILISGVCDPNRRSEDLVAFAIAFVILATYQRLSRRSEIKRGIQNHSYYIGTSVLESIPFLKLFNRYRWLGRFGDSLLCIIVGYVAGNYSRALGGWLIFSGLCLGAFEDLAFRKELHRSLDVGDGLIVAQQQVEIVERLEPTNDRIKAAAIPTGMGDDIQNHLHRRDQP